MIIKIEKKPERCQICGKKAKDLIGIIGYKTIWICQECKEYEEKLEQKEIEEELKMIFDKKK
jgi:ribosomal protein L37AE/L43A